MSEQIKLTEIEIKEIRTLQDNLQKKVFQLGQLRLNQLKLERSLKAAEKNESEWLSNWDSLEKTETDLIDKLLHKYGEGALDLVSGTFTPDVKLGSATK